VNCRSMSLPADQFDVCQALGCDRGDLPRLWVPFMIFLSGRASSFCATASVYSVRMARVNITVPDELLSGARTAGLNVSRLASSALAEELDRRAKIAELDAYLAELESELGPVPAKELADAATWADQIVPMPEPSLSASRATRQPRSA
jgi:post-segregation antitoxin (ccd killing protein)